MAKVEVITRESIETARDSFEAATAATQTAIGNANDSADNADSKATLANNAAALAESSSEQALFAAGVEEEFISTTVDTLPDSTNAVEGTRGAFPKTEGHWQMVEWDDTGSQWLQVGIPFVSYAGMKVDNVTTLSSRRGFIDGQIAELLGRDIPGDGGQGTVYWDASSEEVDNGGTVFEVTDVAVGRWKRPNSNYILSSWFPEDRTGLLKAAEVASASEKILKFPDRDVTIPGGGDLFFTNDVHWEGGAKTRLLTENSPIHFNGSKVVVRNVTFENFQRIRCSGSLIYDIVDFRNCRFINSSEESFYTDRFIKEVYLLDSYFEDIVGIAFHVDGITTTGSERGGCDFAEIRGNILKNCGNGIRIGADSVVLQNEWKNIKVYDNTFENIGNDIDLYVAAVGPIFSTFTDIHDNKIDTVWGANRVQGIYTKVTYSNIHSNILNNAGKRACIVYRGRPREDDSDEKCKAYASKVYNNTIFIDDTVIEDGIWLTGEEVEVYNNRVYGAIYGIRDETTKTDKSSICDNTIQKYRGLAGIYITKGADGLRVCGNTIIDANPDTVTSTIVGILLKGEATGFILSPYRRIEIANNYICLNQAGDKGQEGIRLQRSDSPDPFTNISIKNNEIDVRHYSGTPPSNYGIQVLGESGDYTDLVVAWNNITTDAADDSTAIVVSAAVDSDVKRINNIINNVMS